MSHERKDGKVHLKDEARTPPELFRKLNEKYQFQIDACASENNRLCYQYYSLDFDALDHDWAGIFGAVSESRVYCNPPYSNPTPFIKKAYEESLKGATVVMLLPADTSTKSFHDYCMKADQIIFLEGRVTFNNPDGTPMIGSPKFGNMVAVFERMQPKRVQVRSWDWRNEELP